MKLRKNLMDRLNKRLMRAEGKVSKLENRSEKIIHIEAQRNKRSKV